jgi:polyhydroxybutyrate depolymerase
VWAFLLLATVVRSDGVPGFSEHTIQIGGYTRQFWVYVPSSLGASNLANGLVMFFHGYSVSVQDTCNGIHEYSFQARQQADAKAFIAVCPKGTGADASIDADRGWNNAACCGHGAQQGVDDVGFVNAMLDNLRDDVLPARGVSYPTQNVFAFGFSTGGLFSFRLACELNDRIDGIAPAGAVFDWAFGVEGDMPWAASCSTHTPVWNSLGTQDMFTLASTGLSKWRQYAQQVLSCSAPSEVQSSPYFGGDDVECYEYASCGASDSAAAFCLYDDGLHQVRSQGEATDYWHTDEAWDFLTGSTLPSLWVNSNQQDLLAEDESTTTSTTSTIQEDLWAEESSSYPSPAKVTPSWFYKAIGFFTALALHNSLETF